MSNNYAVLKNNIVVNIIVIDGDGSDYEVSDGESLVKMEDKQFVSIGSVYSGGQFSVPDEPAPTPEEIAERNLLTANSEYESATLHIDALNEQIEDEDYAGTTKEDVKAELAAWTTYRKQLRAYIKAGDGSKALPTKSA